MANLTMDGCGHPFFDLTEFPAEGGFVDGRLCHKLSETLTCCLPCPMTEWVYPDNFTTLTGAGDWVATVSAICCLFLLLSWLCLPVEKTNRHYLSICLTMAVALMNLGFVIPLAAQPEQCYNSITPHSMQTSPVCGVSGGILLFGGWAGVMWAFIRSLSLHLQICWQMLVGRSFMFFAHAAGWGIPIIGLILALVFSGVSFRFGATCHINHENSLAGFWIPMLIFAGLTLIITFATFGYCIKVYLASLGDNSASTENSNLPTYTNSLVTMTPRQAYRRVRRVISLQWRGIAVVVVIVIDVCFFSVVFTSLDQSFQKVTHNTNIAEDWVLCLLKFKGDKDQCLDLASSLTINETTVTAVLLLLGLNGVWLLLFLGRWTMVTGWRDLFVSLFTRNKKEFVSVDARHDTGKDQRSYEMLSKEANSVVTPVSPVQLPNSGRRTPDYFGETARYQPPSRSYSNPRPPQQPSWDPQQTYAPGTASYNMEDMNPLGMNKL